MFDRKGAKKKAKQKLKKHYVIFVIACLIASFIGAEYAESTSFIKSDELSAFDQDSSVVSDLVFGGLEKGQEAIDNKVVVDTYLGPLELGHSNGVLAGITKNATTGSFFVIIYKAISTLIKKGGDIFASITVVIAAIFLSLFAIFIRDAYKVVFRRIYLEGYQYDKVKSNRFLYIFKCHKWFNAAWCIFRMEIYLYLWYLTIIGGIIKSFSYAMVPYIVAENPSIKSSDAIKLSRKMMDGHKWEYCKYMITFIGWWLLDGLTLGVSGVLFSNPYLECFNVEYYAYLRDLAISNKIECYEYLNDEYLFKFANDKTLKDAYPDLEKVKNLKPNFPIYGKLEGFFAKNLGVVLKYDEKSNQYNKALFDEALAIHYDEVFKRETYPDKLTKQHISEKAKKDTITLANRQYSLTTLIIMFFSLSFIGWLWEVMLHILNNGTFVNRGVLKGPWLPVYGSGILLILVVLYRFRKSVVAQFTSAVVLSGFVEYYTSVFLELTHDGMRWWDYSGYFINLNGRICAEGLLVFGLGGCVAVYFLAPLIDNKLRKVKPKILTIVCTLLVVCFVSDLIYSKKHPNMGEGITSEAIVFRNEDIC